MPEIIEPPEWQRRDPYWRGILLDKWSMEWSNDPEWKELDEKINEQLREDELEKAREEGREEEFLRNEARMAELNAKPIVTEDDDFEFFGHNGTVYYRKDEKND